MICFTFKDVTSFIDLKMIHNYCLYFTPNIGSFLYFSALAVRAEVQKPVACLLTCEVKLSDVYLEVPFMHTIKTA